MPGDRGRHQGDFRGRSPKVGLPLASGRADMPLVLVIEGKPYGFPNVISALAVAAWLPWAMAFSDGLEVAVLPFGEASTDRAGIARHLEVLADRCCQLPACGLGQVVLAAVDLADFFRGEGI